MASLRISMFLCVAIGTNSTFAQPSDDDTKLLNDHGYQSDESSLLEFFQKRTLKPRDLKEVRSLILQLGDEEFQTRELATRQLTSRGAVIRHILMENRGNPDVEVARRVEMLLNDLNAATDANIASAASRLLSNTNSSEATPTLLAYLPFNEERETGEVIRDALAKLNPHGKFHPELSRAIDSKESSIRAVGGYLFATQGTSSQRDLAQRLLVDPSPAVRYETAIGFVAIGEARGIPPLIELAATDNISNRAWQAEEILYRLAGQKSPRASLTSGTVEARKQAKQQWLAWWNENRETVDLKNYHDPNRLLSITLGIEYNTGRVWECGMDGKIRWEITGLQGPMEAQRLNNGLVLIAESNAKRFGEWETTGKLVRSTKMKREPTGCQRLPNGNTFVSTHGTVCEYRPDGTLEYDVALSQGSNAIRKLRNGNIVYVANNKIIEMDTAGKQLSVIDIDGRSWTGIRGLTGGRFLVCSSSSGDVVEVDAKGNELWRHRQPGACGIDRLPNGNTLISASQNVYEVTREKKVVWTIRRPGYVRRIHRR